MQSSTLASNNCTPRHSNDAPRNKSLYPSRCDIEAVEIPDSRDVFFHRIPAPDPFVTTSRDQQPTAARSPSSSSSWARDAHMSPAGMLPSIRATSTKSSLSSSSKPKLVTRGDSAGSSTCSKLGMVNVSGPAYTPVDRKPYDADYYSCGSSNPNPANVANCNRVTELEVTPGVFLPLHGSNETLTAMQEEGLLSCTCLVCTQTIMCVSHAAYVLCPDCRVVSPVDAIMGGAAGGGGPSKQRRSTMSTSEGGVGLGMSTAEFESEQRMHRRRNSSY